MRIDEEIILVVCGYVTMLRNERKKYLNANKFCFQLAANLSFAIFAPLFALSLSISFFPHFCQFTTLFPASSVYTILVPYSFWFHFFVFFFLVLRMFHYCTITMEIAIECDTQRKRVRDRQGLSLNCLSILHTLEQCVSFHIVIISRLTGFRCLSNSTLIFPFLWLVFAPILSVPHFRCVPSSNPTKKMETANVEWHDRERKTSIRMKKKRNKSIPIFIWM